LFRKGRSLLPFLGGVGRKEHSSLFSPIFELLIKAHRSSLKQFSYKRRLTIRRVFNLWSETQRKLVTYHAHSAHGTTSILPLVGNPVQAGNLLYFGAHDTTSSPGYSRYDEHFIFGRKPSTSWQPTILRSSQYDELFFSQNGTG
jgi:hypothetical protein